MWNLLDSEGGGCRIGSCVHGRAYKHSSIEKGSLAVGGCHHEIGPNHGCSAQFLRGANVGQTEKGIVAHRGILSSDNVGEGLQFS